VTEVDEVAPPGHRRHVATDPVGEERDACKGVHPRWAAAQQVLHPGLLVRVVRDELRSFEGTLRMFTALLARVYFVPARSLASLTEGLDPATIEPWAIEANNCRCLPRRCPPQPVSLPVESCHVDDKELRGAELRGADAVLICVCSPSIVTLNFTERHGEWCSCC